MVQAGALDILVEAVGAKETKKELSEVSKEFSKSSKDAKKSAGAMASFAKKFAGAISIMSASLATGVGALLVQMPIISEIFTALKFVITSLAFLMDGVLRPVLSPLRDLIFDLGVKLDSLSKPMKTIITIGIIMVGVVAGLTAIFAGLLVLAISVAGALASLAGATIAGTSALVILGASFVIISQAIVGQIIVMGLLVIAFAPLIAVIILLGVLIKKNFGTIKDVVTSVIGTIQGVIGAFMGWVKSNFGEDFEAIMSELKVLWSDLGKTIGFHINNIKNVILLVVGIIKKAWEEDFGGMRTLVTTAFKIMKAVIVPIMTTIGKVIVASVKTIIDVVQLLLAVLRGDWKTVWEEAKSIVSNVVGAMITIVEGVGEAFGGVLNVIIDSMNTVIDGLNTISFKIPDWVPGDAGGKSFGLDIPNIPKLQRGGSVDQTGQAIVHEGETVLTKQLTNLLTDQLGGGGAVGPIEITLKLDGRVIDRAVVKSLNRQMTSRSSN